MNEYSPEILVEKKPEQLVSVTQDNALVSASYTLSLNEKRLILLAVSKIDPTSKMWLTGGEVTIHAKEWTDTYGGEVKNAYTLLRESLNSLYERSVVIWEKDNDGEEIRWLSRKKYVSREGQITLSFGRECLHYLSGMCDYFTSYKLLAVAGLKSIYSIRFYELARQFVSTGWRYIELDDLRKMLQLENQYPVWQDLKKRVIDTACKEISAKSDLELTYDIVKKGRTVVAIKLKVKQQSHQLSLY